MRTIFCLVVLLLVTSPCLGGKKKMKLLKKQVAEMQAMMDEMAQAGGDMDGKLGEMSGDVESMDGKLKDLQQQVKAALSDDDGGSTYVRWGRMDCPATADLVYSGYAGGSVWRQAGGAANYLCLTKEPIFDYVEPEEQNSGGLVYGAEYEPYRKNPEGFVGKDLDDYDVPCAVCRTKRSSVLMIPGRNACSSNDWTLEYKGYLSSGSAGQPSATEFVCLDGQAEALPGVHKNVDGKLFYFVEGRCGSLKCPPYINGHELTCAVCSK